LLSFCSRIRSNRRSPFQFALPVLVESKPQVPGQLLRDGGGAFGGAALLDIDANRLHDPQGVEAGVFEEAFVLNRNYRIDERAGKVFEAENAAFLPFLVE
jgi:hypothetical protein